MGRALLVTGRTASRPRPRRGVAAGFANRRSPPGEPTVEDARRGADVAARGCGRVVASGRRPELGKAVAALLARGDRRLPRGLGPGRPSRSRRPRSSDPTRRAPARSDPQRVLASPEHRVKPPPQPADAPAPASSTPTLLGLPPHVWPRRPRRLRPARRAVLSVRRTRCGRPLPRGARRRRSCAGRSRATPRGGPRRPRACQPLRGLALANAGSGLHGFAPPSGLFEGPHGAACAASAPSCA